MQNHNYRHYIIAGLGIILTTLTGCSIFDATPQPTPTINVPDSFDHHTYAQTAIGNGAITAMWWTRFNDPTLNILVESALEHNNVLQEAIVNINVARIKLEEVHMSWVPTIGLGGTAGVGQIFNYNSGVSGQAAQLIPGANANNENFNFYAAGLVPNYSFNILGLNRASDIAKENIAYSESVRDATKLTIISQVIGSYFTLLALKQQLQQQQNLVRDLNQLVNFSKIEYHNGYVGLAVVEEYRLQLTDATMQLPQIKDNIVITENALNVLLNQNPGKLLTTAIFKQIKLSDIIPNRLPSSVLHRRPDIMQAEEQLKIANADVALAKANFFPSIDITTPVGAFNNAFGNLFNPAGDFWATQITAVMPILNLGLYSLVKEKKAAYYLAYYNYIQVVKSAFAEVDNDFANIQQSQQTYLLALQLFHVSYTNFMLARTNYQLGYAAYSDILPTKINLDKAELIITQAKLQRLQAVVSLYQALAIK